MGAVELKALDFDVETREMVDAAYRALVSGRWSLGANEVDFFAGALEGILGSHRLDPVHPPRFSTNAGLRGRSTSAACARPSVRYGETFPASLDAAAASTCCSHASPGRPSVGLRVSMHWLQERVVRRTADDLNVAGGAE